MKTVVLVGHQNVGKTTLFNLLTHSSHKVVNYPGSTVECFVGFLAQASDCPARLIDTPGISSLNPKTLDEEVTFKALTQLNQLVNHSSATPDLVVAVADCTQLSRQLPLIRQLKRSGVPLLLALSKGDLKGKAFSSLSPSVLELELGCPVVLFSSKEVLGIQPLQKQIEEALSKPAPSTPPQFFGLPTNFIEDYAWAKSLASRSVQMLPETQRDLDRLFLHPWIGPLLFVAIMVGFFWSIFSFTSPFIEGIESGVGMITSGIQALLPPSLFQEFLTDGLVQGLGAVLVFTPQIFFLFLILGFLEGSGYLARGAVLIDRPLSAIGLSGKSFVPLLSGCACAIPAMMAARTIPSKKERLTTLFIIPLMTCSARLPVYGLLITLLLGRQHAMLSGLILAGIYLGSIVFASVTAVIFGHLIGLKKQSVSFQIELPRWHLPKLSVVARQAIDQTMSFLKKAGIPIAVISMCLWVLSTFPSKEFSFIHSISYWIEPLLRPMGVDGKMGVALLLSFAAREVFASSVALLYPQQSLVLSIASVLSLIVFFMVSMQCLATVAVAKKEMGGWKLPLIMMASYVLAAYLLACLVYALVNLF